MANPEGASAPELANPPPAPEQSSRDEAEFEFEGDDGLQQLLQAADDFKAPGSTRRPKAKAKGKAKATAATATGGKGEGLVIGNQQKKASGRETYLGRQCIICQSADSCTKNPYCGKCKADVDALQKCAKDDGWLEKFMEAKGNERALRKLVRDFQQESPSKGKGRPRAKYSKAKALQILSNESIEDQGTRLAKYDWFEFEAHYESKKLSHQQIEEKWRSRLASEGPVDCLGENPDYPQRLLVRVEDYIDAKRRKRVSNEVQREMVDKKMLADDSAQNFMDGEAQNRPADFFSGAAEKMFNDRDRPAQPARRRSTGSNASISAGTDEEKAAAGGSTGAAGDLTVSRLRAFEETGEQINKVLTSLAATIEKVDKEASFSVARVSDWLLDSRKLAIGSD